MIGRAGQVDHDHPVVVGAVYLTTVMAGTVSHADISILALGIIDGAIAIDVNIDAPALNRAINRTAGKGHEGCDCGGCRLRGWFVFRNPQLGNR